MKNSKMYLLAFLVVTFINSAFFIGCKQNSSAPQEAKFINPYTIVGELHNQAFIFIHDEIKKEKLSGWIPTKIEFENKVLAYLDEYSSANELKSSMRLLKSSYPQNKKSILLKTTLFENVSPIQQYYLDKIDSILFEKDGLAALQEALYYLDIEVSQTLNEQEAAPILNKSAVAVASYTYWSENFDNWVNMLAGENLLNKNSQVQQEESIYDRLVKADTYGAAAGALVAIASGQFWDIIGLAVTCAAYGTAIEMIVILFELLT